MNIINITLDNDIVYSFNTFTTSDLEEVKEKYEDYKVITSIDDLNSFIYDQTGQDLSVYQYVTNDVLLDDINVQDTIIQDIDLKLYGCKLLDYNLFDIPYNKILETENKLYFNEFDFCFNPSIVYSDGKLICVLRGRNYESSMKIKYNKNSVQTIPGNGDWLVNKMNKSSFHKYEKAGDNFIWNFWINYL